MTDSTKQKAYVKLDAMKKKVGYPDKWKDFSAMQVGKESYVQNSINANLWWHNYNMNKLGKPVDRDEWEMTPQTYNAYYNPSTNGPLTLYFAGECTSVNKRLRSCSSRICPSHPSA